MGPDNVCHNKYETKVQEDSTVSEKDPVSNQNLEASSKVSVETAQDATSPYGPWMLVKRQQRKKPVVQPKQDSDQQGENQNNGSRFSLLQQTTKAEDSKDIAINSQNTPQQQIVKVRNPTAGKNSQKSNAKKPASKPQPHKAPVSKNHNQNMGKSTELISKNQQINLKPAKIPNEPILTNVHIQQSGKNTTDQPSSSSIKANNIDREEQFRREQDHLLTMKLMQKKISGDQLLLDYNRAFLAANDGYYNE
ncbi:hypothetical protein SESBI_38755 [Sesbania bispinosa]|nr:hypothetical protein SESBI_38755 [Sesbania bispinosa]